MRATLRFNLGDEVTDFEQAPLTGPDKDSLLDTCDRVVRASVVKAAVDMLVHDMFPTIQQAYEAAHAAIGGDIPYVVRFDDGTEEEKIADISIQSLHDLLWGNHVPDAVKDFVRNHVRNCDNDHCPVNATFNLIGVEF